MKIALVLIVVLAGIWLWRASRKTPSQRSRTPHSTGSAPLEMISCALCSVHIPSAEVVQGKRGAYCCADHRHRAEP